MTKNPRQTERVPGTTPDGQAYDALMVEVEALVQKLPRCVVDGCESTATIDYDECGIWRDEPRCDGCSKGGLSVTVRTELPYAAPLRVLLKRIEVER